MPKILEDDEDLGCAQDPGNKTVMLIFAMKLYEIKILFQPNI